MSSGLCELFITYLELLFSQKSTSLGGIVHWLTVDEKNTLEEVVGTSKKTCEVRQWTTLESQYNADESGLGQKKDAKRIDKHTKYGMEK